MAYKIEKVKNKFRVTTVETRWKPIPVEYQGIWWVYSRNLTKYKKPHNFKTKAEAEAFIKNWKAEDRWDKSITTKDILKALVGIKKTKLRS